MSGDESGSEWLTKYADLQRVHRHIESTCSPPFRADVFDPSELSMDAVTSWWTTHRDRSEQEIRHTRTVITANIQRNATAIRTFLRRLRHQQRANDDDTAGNDAVDIRAELSSIEDALAALKSSARTDFIALNVNEKRLTDELRLMSDRIKQFPSTAPTVRRTSTKRRISSAGITAAAISFAGTTSEGDADHDRLSSRLYDLLSRGMSNGWDDDDHATVVRVYRESYTAESSAPSPPTLIKLRSLLPHLPADEIIRHFEWFDQCEQLRRDIKRRIAQRRRARQIEKDRIIKQREARQAETAMVLRSKEADSDELRREEKAKLIEWRSRRERDAAVAESAEQLSSALAETNRRIAFMERQRQLKLAVAASQRTKAERVLETALAAEQALDERNRIAASTAQQTRDQRLIREVEEIERAKQKRLAAESAERQRTERRERLIQLSRRAIGADTMDELSRQSAAERLISGTTEATRWREVENAQKKQERKRSASMGRSGQLQLEPRVIQHKLVPTWRSGN